MNNYCSFNIHDEYFEKQHISIAIATRKQCSIPFHFILHNAIPSNFIALLAFHIGRVMLALCFSSLFNRWKPVSTALLIPELNCLHLFQGLKTTLTFTCYFDPSYFMKLRSVNGSIISLTVVQWFLQHFKIPDVHTVAISTRFFFMPLTRLVRFITAKVTRQTKFVSHTFEALVSRLDFFDDSIESGQCPLCNITPFDRLSMD